MKNKNYIKPIVLLLIVAGLTYVLYNGFTNYQRNKIIKESNTNITYSDSNSTFKKFTDSGLDYQLNQSILDSIKQIKDSITKQFLDNTEERIVFLSHDIDTLRIKIDKKQNSDYSSSFNKGIYHKKFTDLLVKSLEPFLFKYQITRIDIYCLIPTEYDNIPLIPPTLANFDYEKEYDFN